MKRLLQFLIRIYPAPWRQRYEAEFGALLEDVNPTPSTVIDVFLGGIAMNLKMFASWKLFALTSFVGLVVALGVAFAITDQYLSTSVIKLPSSTNVQAFLSRDILSDQTLGRIIERNGLYQELRSKEPLKSAIEQMKKDLVIRPVSVAGAAQQSGSAMMVQFRYYDRHLAQRACSSLVNLITKAGPHADVTDELLDSPSLPTLPFYPNRLAIAITGLLGGLLLGLPVILFRRIRKLT